ncbi:pumilio domain member 6 [Kluyveromyces marxianus]|nr:pumilio domain member 6 [Kluyveromyces marxianus]KAG0677444.1 pumilio domain member 6 [Kluyveromyces marxianus]
MAPTTKKVNKRQSTSKDSGKIVKRAKNISVYSSDEESDAALHGLSSEDELDDASEDELDNAPEESEESDESDALDEDSEANSDEEDNEETGADEKKEGNGVSQHAEQRKTLKERKLQRKSGERVQQIKSLWEKLRVKSPPIPKPVREKLCNEIWELSSDCIEDLVLKHDASRIVQTLVKYSSKERREQITLALKDKIYVLATSSYGKYLLVKLLHYGSRSSRQLIIDQLHGSLRKLMRHREGAYVVEDLFVLYASQEQRNQMILEFWGSEYAAFRETHKGLTIEQVCETSVEKRNIIARNLIGTITASVEKGSAGFQILHAAMREYVKIANEKEISEFIELLEEHFAELVHTPEGAEVAATLIAKANAKERKAIIKNLKEHTLKLIQNEHGAVVFITLLMTVDDTVLVSKAFAPSIKEELATLIVDKFGRRPFLFLLLGLDGKYFGPNLKKELEKYIKMSENTSKKPFDQRRLELLKRFAPMILSTTNEHYKEILNENIGSQFVADLLVNDEVYEQLSEADQKLFAELVDTVAIYFKGDISDYDHPINKPFSARLLKSLIQNGRYNVKAKKLEPLQKVQGLGVPFAQRFYEDIIDSSNLLDWINKPSSSFTIVALYEALHGTKEGKQFDKDLKKVIKEISADESNKGAHLLLKLIK